MSDTASTFTVPADISRALGNVVIAWARIEALLAEFLSFLLQANPGHMYVLNQDVASATQLKWIRVLSDGRFTHEGTRSNLKILFDRIDAARSERNGYVHGMWSPGPEPDTAMVQTVKLDRAEIIRSELVTRSDLDDLFRDIASMGDELDMIGIRLRFVGPDAI